MPTQPKKRGPKPERVKIEGDWENAVGKALKKKRPKDGWPQSGSHDVKTDEKSHSKDENNEVGED